MRCEMPQCKYRAKLKISMTSGKAYCYCFKHGYLFVKAQLRALGRHDFGIFIQRPPEPAPEREMSEEVRRYVTTPEDRKRQREENPEAEWIW